MLAKRVIPCLDVHAGRVTRGQQFGRAEENGLRNVGDPVELAIRYNDQGAGRTGLFRHHRFFRKAGNRSSMSSNAPADRCFMPLTVGGGVRSTDDMRTLLRAGADKISLNSAALGPTGNHCRRGRGLWAPVQWSFPSTPKKQLPASGRYFLGCGREQTAWEARGPGRKKRSPWGRGKLCSTASTRMACRPAMISKSRG